MNPIFTFGSFTFGSEDKGPGMLGKPLQKDANKEHKNKKESEIEFYQDIGFGLTTVPPRLCLFTNLRTLDLSDNKITSINLPSASRITHLFLSNNQIYFVGTLPRNLIYLDMCKNKLTSVEWQTPLDQYTELSKMLLNDNTIRRLECKMPPNLVHLECMNNRVFECNIDAPLLQILKLRENRLDRLEINSAHLHYLDCSRNMNLPTLPFLPQKLRHLNISETDIDNDDGAISNLPSSIEYLNMESCCVDELPRLPSSLTHLYASNCGIAFAPYLKELNRADVIDVSYNDLTELTLPASAVSVNCSYNAIASLTIPYHSELAGLNCCDNMIRTFKHIPTRVKDIKSFICHNNPFFFLRAGKVSMLNLPLLRKIAMAHNAAYAVSRVVNNPSKFEHLFSRDKGRPLYTRMVREEQALCNRLPQDCSVCYDEMEDDAKCVTVCHHAYCMKCMPRLSSQCPMCRDRLEWKIVPRVYGRPRLVMESMRGSRQFNIYRAWEPVMYVNPPISEVGAPA